MKALKVIASVVIALVILFTLGVFVAGFFYLVDKYEHLVPCLIVGAIFVIIVYMISSGIYDTLFNKGKK